MGGKTAILEVSDFGSTGSISVDSFTFSESAYGCLPSCMHIEAKACPDNKLENCLHFEGDDTPYRRVKETGATSGTYCRAVPRTGEGSVIGPGIEYMGSWTKAPKLDEYEAGQDQVDMTEAQEDALEGRTPDAAEHTDDDVETGEEGF